MLNLLSLAIYKETRMPCRQYTPKHLCSTFKINQMSTITTHCPPYHLPPPFSPLSLHTSSLQERGWKCDWDSHFRPWSLSLAVCGRWRCACWWPPPFSPWRSAGACVWAGAGTWGKPAARPPWRCRRTSAEGNRKKRAEWVSDCFTFPNVMGKRTNMFSLWAPSFCSPPPSPITPHQLSSELSQGKMVAGVAGWEWRECWVGTGEEVGWREVLVHRLCSRV